MIVVSVTQFSFFQDTEVCMLHFCDRMCNHPFFYCSWHL